MSLADYYKNCGIPKVRPTTPIKAQKGQRPANKAKRAKTRGIRTAGRSVKGKIFDRQSDVCIAAGVSPVCTSRVEDPHELIPGRPRRITLSGSVGVCRACHNVAQGRVGGNLLVFDWAGKSDGAKPRAHITGNVRPIWVGKATTA